MSKTPRWALKKIKETKKKQYKELDLSVKWDEKNKEKLIQIPDEVFELEWLEILSLSGNQLSTIPDSITRLQKLTSLVLIDNQLSSIPDSMARLQNLTSLVLSANQLTSIPDSMARLQNLIWLDLRANQLTTIPDSISKLRNLTKLSIHGNQFTSLPESIIQLKNLKSLILVGNPIETPPPEVVGGYDKILGPEEIEKIKNYFRQLEKEGKDYLYEAKLLIVGEAGAGKTTLAKKIDNPNYELRDDEESTEGIDVIKWDFPLQSGGNFQVNIWDFGGQEIYHATHQFFLTKRSLYALVADTRKEDTDFYYWLNVVELLSDNSPLLIIKNEKQDRHREINERQLRAQFTSLKETLATNLATNRGLDKIFEEIKHYIAQLPHIGSALPKTWVKVREKLEQNPRNYISLDEYLDICEQNGFTQMKDKLQLSGYLHDLGVCLHFQQDPLLKKTVILNPKWGTDAVYSVLDNDDVIRNLGQFSKKDLAKIWDVPQYAGMHDELLQLMINFQLCYPLPDCCDEYIAPQLLAANQPDYGWDERDNLILRYTYEFMPKGIITRFMVAMHKYIADQRYVWRSGLILEKDQTRAEVIEYFGKREMKIRISGKHKKELMTIVMHELDKIHDCFNRLKYNKLIPCNCSICKNNQNPHFYPFEKLKKFIGDRQPIQCPESYEMVNVWGLIENVIDIHETKKLAKEFFRDSMREVLRESAINLNIIQRVEQNQTVSQTQKTEINIEIKNHIDALAKTFRNMKEDMLDGIEDPNDKKKLGKELDKLENALDQVKQIESKDQAKSSPALDRLKRFIDKLGDSSTRAGKTIKAIEDGIGYAQDLAKNYNKIAQWCGLPVVPDLFLKKNKK